MDSPLVLRVVGDGAKLTLASSGEDRPSLSLETKIPNQPLLKLTQGHLELRNLSLEHSSSVNMITLITCANNNAAVVVSRPPQGETPPEASVALNHVTLRSYTGKGTINHNSACTVTRNDCHVISPLY